MKEQKKRNLEFQKALREQRLKKGFTLKDLADIAGVSFVTLSRYEHGFIANPGIQNLVALAKALGKKSDFFARYFT